MLTSAFHRFFVHYEITIRAARGRGPALPLTAPGKNLSAIDVWKSAQGHPKGTLVFSADDELEIFKVAERPRDNLVVIIFKRSDPNAAKQTYSHKKTKALRHSDKKDDESVAHSSHLFIGTKNIGTGKEPKYNAYLEEIPGISRTGVLSILNRALRETPYSYKDAYDEDQEGYGLIKLLGVPSTALGTVMSQSRVPGVTLVRKATIEGFDSEGLAFPGTEKKRIKLKPTPDVVGLLRRLRSYASDDNWDDMRIDVDLPDKRSRTVSVDRDEDAGNVLFVRSIEVKVAKPIPACSDVVNEELVAFAKANL